MFCPIGDICSIGPTSHCRAAFIMFYYNVDKRKCEQKTADGCHPSGWNGFRTKNDCRKHCIRGSSFMIIDQGPVYMDKSCPCPSYRVILFPRIILLSVNMEKSCLSCLAQTSQSVYMRPSSCIFRSWSQLGPSPSYIFLPLELPCFRISKSPNLAKWHSDTRCFQRGPCRSHQISV